MTSLSRSAAMVSLLLAVAMLLAACGPGGTATPAPPPTLPATATPSVEATATAPPAPTPTPTPAPTPAPAATPTPVLTPPVAVPAGWALQWTRDFAVAVPSDWVAVDMDPNTVDAAISGLKATYPDLVPMVQSFKKSPAIEFWAIEAGQAAYGYAPNILVSRELRLVSDPNGYVDAMKKQMEPYGYSFGPVEKVSSNGVDALKLRISFTQQVSGGSPVGVEEQGLVVDWGVDRYSLILSYGADDTGIDFDKVFDLLAQTFRILAPVPTPAPKATPAPGTPGPVDLQALKQKLDETAQRVSALRQLTPKQEIAYQFIPAADLSKEVLSSFDRFYPVDRIKTEQELWTLLDMLPQGTDLYATLAGVYGEQVAGFYDEETHRMYVVGDSAEPDVISKVVFAHEYTHALQDQYFDLSALPNETNANDDQALAVQALIEGDATLVQSAYLQGLSQSDLRDAVGKLNQMQMDKYNAAPAMVRDEMTFPYEAGVNFVVAMGGWDAVNKVYGDPPQSTAQILHPDKYANHMEPVAVELPDLSTDLGPGWTQQDNNVLGEFGIDEYLKTYLDTSVAATAAAGWAGDRYEYLKDAAGDKVFVLKSTWDTASDAQEFFDAYVSFVGKKSNGGWMLRTDEAGKKWWTSSAASVCLSKSGSDVLLVIAPTDAVATAVMQQMSRF